MEIGVGGLAANVWTDVSEIPSKLFPSITTPKSWLRGIKPS